MCGLPLGFGCPIPARCSRYIRWRSPSRSRGRTWMSMDVTQITCWVWKMGALPSGKRLHNELERSTIFKGVNPRTKSPFSIANCNKLPKGTSLIFGFCLKRPESSKSGQNSTFPESEINNFWDDPLIFIPQIFGACELGIFLPPKLSLLTCTLQ